MKNIGFEGWYFKHQKGDDTVAFIPGRAQSGAFIQMLCSGGSRQFEITKLSAGGGIIRADGCLFTPFGCKIVLPGVSGKLSYGTLTPLAYDIMGPFRFFPMECRHGILSMAHTLRGSLQIDGQPHCFDGGIGYMEKDSGTSFPSAYQWMQCNTFSEACSIMVSIAQIPFCGMHFQGCICAIVYRGRAYRLATYDGVRILAAESEHICLSQGRLLLEIDCKPTHGGHTLRSPVKGQMSGIIRESNNAAVRVRLWERAKPVFDLCTNSAAYEFVPPQSQPFPDKKKNHCRSSGFCLIPTL